MKKLLDLMNENLGTDFKTVAEYGANADKIDMAKVAETLYQYMNYQEAVENVNMEQFKVKLIVKKDE